MTALLRDRITVVWTALVVATAISWFLGTRDAEDSTGATVAVLVVAFAKVRFVGAYFMELRAAPAVLRHVFEAYVGVVGAAVVVLYLAG